MDRSQQSNTKLKVIWVYENIEKNLNFYSKLDLLLLLSSISLWKRNHREDTCVLYCDEMSYDVLYKLKVIEFWDEVLPIPNPKKINKSVFWASSKLQVLSEVKDPVILMDHDTHIYKPFKQFLDLDKVYVTNFEKGQNFYPNSTDKYIKQLSYKPRWQTDSVNVSFLNLPDPTFTQEYANLSLQLMEELTAIKAPNPQYLIFSEQLLLKHLLLKTNIQHSSIISTYWDCKKWDWGEDHNQGLWPFNDSYKYFKHYGPLKGAIKDSREGESYNGEIIHLKNCIKMPNLDLSNIKNK